MKARKRARVIAMLGQKGGGGKTTIALHLAVCAQQAGEAVAVLDTDPQESAKAWVGQRELQDPAVAAITPAEVEPYLHKLNDVVTLTLIDTAPRAGPETFRAVQFADLILVPCRPSFLDIATLPAVARIVEAAGRPTAFVLSACPSRGDEVDRSRKVLETYGYPIAPVTIGHRKAFARAMESGEAVTEFEPSGVAAEEIRGLWNWIQERIQ